MSDLLPIFSSHYGFTFQSDLTFEPVGKTKAGNPVSICDIAKDNGLKEVTVVDERIDGLLEAHTNLSKIGVQLIFGLKLCVCADENDKTDASLATESNVIVFANNSNARFDLTRISSRAWTDNYYHQGRTSWRQLNELWTSNLTLALPTYSSFLFKNQMTFANIVPDFPVPPILFRETDSGLPFAPIIDEAITRFAGESGYEVQPVKSIYYLNAAAFDAYVNFRAIGNRAEFQRPNVDHLCSDQFSFEAYKRLSA